MNTMQLIKRKITVLAASLFLVILGSCSKNDSNPNSGTLSVSAKGTFGSTSAKSPTGKAVSADVDVTDFRMNLKEFKLELDVEDPGDDYQDDENDNWDDDGLYDFEDDIKLAGPFELDLMAGQVSFMNASLPVGNFEEVKFKFDAGTDASSDLFGKSVLIKGTIQGTPFIFWHDFEDEVEVDFEDPTFDIAITQTPEGIVIEFDLSQVFDSVAGVDLTQANDGNMDGTIEISPKDEDGNNALAQLIREAIKSHIDLLDD